ncbi:MAG: 3-phosphoshikimate 1-carboxyvinyltransferase [Rickettsiales bacterium]
MEEKPSPAESTRARSLRGTITVPGDKSISHRALMLASQAIGHTEIHGLLEGEDVLRTAEALKACGVPITRDANGVWQVDGLGIGGLQAPQTELDMGNAGTAARLLMGLLAPYPYHVRFTGDASLRKRPMLRVITPLQEIGAQFEASDGGRLPLTLHGTDMPLPIAYTLPVASAQVKSAVLLAGINIPGITTVIENEPTRDHTERMLGFFGVEVASSPHRGGGVKITLHGQPSQKLQNRALHVPADPSSAAFPIVAALIVPGSEITVQGVCLNPLRTGLFAVLKRMGADLTIHNEREVGGEPVGDITARSSILHGVEVEAQIAPSMIDEYPILAVAAAFAQGTTTMCGLGELRVKESDRLAAIIAGLNANGAHAEAVGDDLTVRGTGHAPTGGGNVTTHFDHRIAMSFLVMGLASKHAVTVDDTRAIATSFPGFMALMAGLGASIQQPKVAA